MKRTIGLVTTLLLGLGSALIDAKPRTFSPTLVRGKTVSPAGSGGSFRLPAGWRHGWGKGIDGKTAYNLNEPGGRAVISINRVLLSGREVGAGPRALLEVALRELLDGTPVRRVVPTEGFVVKGKPAGRVVVQGVIDGQRVEGYLGAIIAGRWAFGVVGIYRASDAAIGRAAADTVLATLEVRAPKPNPAITRALVGCWKHYRSTRKSDLTIVVELDASGSYRRRYTEIWSSDEFGAHIDSPTSGSWAVVDGDLLLIPEDKPEKTFELGRAGGALVLGGHRYRRCR